VEREGIEMSSKMDIEKMLLELETMVTAAESGAWEELDKIVQKLNMFTGQSELHNWGSEVTAAKQSEVMGYYDRLINLTTSARTEVAKKMGGAQKSKKITNAYLAA